MLSVYDIVFILDHNLIVNVGFPICNLCNSCLLCILETDVLLDFYSLMCFFYIIECHSVPEQNFIFVNPD